MTEANALKLAALDEDDLAVISAHVQDAVFKASEVIWTAQAGRFVVPMNRFAWERTSGPRGSRPPSARGGERHRSVLQFDRVRRVRSIGLGPNEREAVRPLLAVLFEPTDPPSGVVNLVCSGDSVIRLDVECIEARLTDLGSAWSASSRPRHRTGR